MMFTGLADTAHKMLVIQLSMFLVRSHLWVLPFYTYLYVARAL